jgi:chromatin remodeling complex protein RSC6
MSTNSTSPYHTNEKESIPFMISGHRVSNEMAKFFNIHPENQILGNQMVKLLVDYVIEQDLISKNNHKNIICNKELCKLLKVNSFATRDVQTLLSTHLTPVKYGEMLN